MTGWIVTIAFLLAPLGCWALLARTKVLGWTFTFVLAAYAVTEWILAPGWMLGLQFSGVRLWLVPGLAVMSVVALVVGTRLENRDLGIPRMRSTRRTSAGLIVSWLYGVVVALGALIFALLGPDSPLASPALVTPLGPGLTVGHPYLNCSGGSNEDIPCTEEFQVRGTAGLSGQALLQLVQARLTQLHGWPDAYETACRLLSGHMTCVTITPDRGGVRISVVESADAQVPEMS